jgi:hypothetical protein
VIAGSRLFDLLYDSQHFAVADRLFFVASGRYRLVESASSFLQAASLASLAFSRRTTPEREP